MSSLASSAGRRNCPSFVRSVDSDGRPVVINVNQILSVRYDRYCGYTVEIPAGYIQDGIQTWERRVERSELQAAGVPLPC